MIRSFTPARSRCNFSSRLSSRAWSTNSWKPAMTGGQSEAQTDVRLARARVSKRDDVVAAQDVFAAGEFENQHLVEAGNGREVERVETFHRGEARLTDAPFDNAPFPIDEFQFDQSQEIGRVIDPLARRFSGHLVVLA